MIVISPIFYPIFTLTITVIACFTRKKKKIVRGFRNHTFTKASPWTLASPKTDASIFFLYYPLQEFMKLCYRRSWSYVTNVHEVMLQTFHEVMLQTFMKLCYRRSWSYVTDVARILCNSRYERDELFSQMWLKLCLNFRNVYVLMNVLMNWACACMTSLSGGV